MKLKPLEGRPDRVKEVGVNYDTSEKLTKKRRSGGLKKMDAAATDALWNQIQANRVLGWQEKKP
jgi:hypothetical protein